jgi:hypothetical protein
VNIFATEEATSDQWLQALNKSNEIIKQNLATG